MARLEKTLKTIKALPPDGRIRLAERKADELWNYVVGLIQTHANNRIINYTDHLSKQVGRSFAAHAFLDFQHAMFSMELTKLTAIWDKPDLGKFCIPTVVELIDDAIVLRRLYRRRLLDARDVATRMRLAGDDASDRDAVAAVLARMRVREAEDARTEFRRYLRWGVDLGRAVARSKRLASIRAFRDRYVAHHLDVEDPDVRAHPYTPPKHGDERRLLRTTCRVTDALNVLIRGAGFAYDSSFAIAARNAGYLWYGCRFENIR